MSEVIVVKDLLKNYGNFCAVHPRSSDIRG